MMAAPSAPAATCATPADLGGKHGRHATLEWPCGDAYDGWAANGKRQGRGTYTFANGATLECDWVEDAPGGRGVFKVPRGAVYRGPFRDGLFHGKGVLKFGGNTYRGAFRAGAFHGSGTLALAGGDRYEGAFRNHRFHGRGAYFWKSGQRYEGLFEDGAMTGRGVASWPGGQRYAGDYVDGRREGRGDQDPFFVEQGAAHLHHADADALWHVLQQAMDDDGVLLGQLVSRAAHGEAGQVLLVALNLNRRASSIDSGGA